MMLKILLLTMILASPAFADYSESPGWVAGLKAAENTTQLAIVSGTHGSSARFSFHEKDSSGTWREIVSCPAYIGKKGWGKSREGDMKSPAGVYTFISKYTGKAQKGKVIPKNFS